VLVFAYIYEGAAQFDKADGIVTLYPIGGQPLRVDLDGQGGNSKICAVALLTPEGGGLTVRRKVQYVDGFHEALDRAYGWGMNWSRGSK